MEWIQNETQRDYLKAGGDFKCLMNNTIISTDSSMQ